MGFSMLSPEFLPNNWLDNDFLDDDWIVLKHLK